MNFNRCILILKINVFKSGSFHKTMKFLKQIFIACCLKRCKIYFRFLHNSSLFCEAKSESYDEERNFASLFLLLLIFYMITPDPRLKSRFFSSYRGSRQNLMQAKTLARCPHKHRLPVWIPAKNPHRESVFIALIAVFPKYCSLLKIICHLSPADSAYSQDRSAE